MKSLNSKAMKELRAQLAHEYGFEAEFSYVIFANEEDKYYIATRDVAPFLDKNLRIERLGIYFGQLQHGELRLSIEGSQLIGPHATKRVLELTPQQRDEWMLGKDVPIPEEHEQRFHIAKCREDFLGCGKWKNGVLQNYVPKERYIGATFPDFDDGKE